MKQSNITTPRTLADCQFVIGHQAAIDSAAERGHAAVYIISVIGLVAFVALIFAGVL